MKELVLKINSFLEDHKLLSKIVKSEPVGVFFGLIAFFILLFGSVYIYHYFIGPEIVEPAWMAISGFFKSIGTTALLWGIFIGVVIIGLK